MVLWTVVEGDCHAELQKCSQKFNAVIVDPPYGTTRLGWDRALDWPFLWAEIDRLLTPAGNVLVFSAQPFTTDLINSNRKHYRYELIWRKTTATRFLDANRRPLLIHESIQVFNRGRGFYRPQKVFVGEKGKNVVSRHSRHGLAWNAGGKITSYKDDGFRHPTTVLDYAKPNRLKKHSPTEKPVYLLRWMIRSYVPEGGMVLDFCAGSGSTAVAGILEGVGGMAIEKDPDYAGVIKRRIAETEGELSCLSC